MLNLTIQDRTAVGRVLQEMDLSFLADLITVEDLIRQRVTQEVARYNARPEGAFNGLVQPTDSESTLNGYKLRTRRPIDTEQQVQVALRAFQENGFFIIVDERQLEHLDDPIPVHDNLQVTFMRLMPLVGG